jgi:hypothetical protein
MNGNSALTWFGIDHNVDHVRLDNIFVTILLVEDYDLPGDRKHRCYPDRGVGDLRYLPLRVWYWVWKGKSHRELSLGISGPETVCINLSPTEANVYGKHLVFVHCALHISNVCSIAVFVAVDSPSNILTIEASPITNLPRLLLRPSRRRNFRRSHP